MGKAQAYFERIDDRSYLPSAHTQGPWDPRFQHGGPPAALLAREIERCSVAEGAIVGRISYDIRGPMPLQPMTVRAWVERPGKRVRLVCGELVHNGAALVSASAWMVRPAPQDLPANTTGGRPADLLPPNSLPEWDSRSTDDWICGFLASIEWRFAHGGYGKVGPAAVWIRPRVPLLAGESLSPVQQIVLTADSANGISAELNIRDWAFVPPELTVHVVRAPRGEWLCLDAVSAVQPGAVGLTTATLYDLDGPVARSAQSLLLDRQRPVAAS